MDADLKKRWVEALRSGDYKQGRRVLRQDDMYCCLGVLCDLAATGEWRRQPDGQTHVYSVDGEYDDIYMPWPVMAFCGLDHNKEMAVSTMNDDGKSFADIASWIEANL
ncbi:MULTISPECIES: hypothetical protein [unclassified Bradyrhizobium]